MHRLVNADRGDAGRRLDLVLRRHLADVDDATRTRVQTWIENGLVTVNGSTIRRVAARAALGDRIAVQLSEPPPRTIMAAEDTTLEVEPDGAFGGDVTLKLALVAEMPPEVARRE